MKKIIKVALFSMVAMSTAAKADLSDLVGAINNVSNAVQQVSERINSGNEVKSLVTPMQELHPAAPTVSVSASQQAMLDKEAVGRNTDRYVPDNENPYKIAQRQNEAKRRNMEVLASQSADPRVRQMALDEAEHQRQLGVASRQLEAINNSSAAQRLQATMNRSGAGY